MYLLLPFFSTSKWCSCVMFHISCLKKKLNTYIFFVIYSETNYTGKVLVRDVSVFTFYRFGLNSETDTIPRDHIAPWVNISKFIKTKLKKGIKEEKGQFEIDLFPLFLSQKIDISHHFRPTYSIVEVEVQFSQDSN